MRKLTYLIICLCFFSSSHVFANGFKKCGFYKLEGYLTTRSSRIEILLNRGAHSQVTVALKRNLPIAKITLGPAVVRLRVRKKCEYACAAEALEVISLIDPFEKPNNPFFPLVEPEPEEKCL